MDGCDQCLRTCHTATNVWLPLAPLPFPLLSVSALHGPGSSGCLGKASVLSPRHHSDPLLAAAFACLGNLLFLYSPNASRTRALLWVSPPPGLVTTPPPRACLY